MRKQQLPKYQTIDEVLERLQEKLGKSPPGRQAELALRIDYLKSRREEFERKEVSALSKKLIYYICDYGLIETEPLLALCASGHSNGKRRLCALWQTGHVKRFKLEDNCGLVYYATRKGVSLLSQVPGLDVETMKRIADNKNTADYANAKSKGQYTRLHGVNHRVRISRFHTRIELGCMQLANISFSNFRFKPRIKLSRPQLKIFYNQASDTFKTQKGEAESITLVPDFGMRLLFDDGKAD